MTEIQRLSEINFPDRWQGHILRITCFINSQIFKFPCQKIGEKGWIGVSYKTVTWGRVRRSQLVTFRRKYKRLNCQKCTCSRWTCIDEIDLSYIQTLISGPVSLLKDHEVDQQFKCWKTCCKKQGLLFSSIGIIWRIFTRHTMPRRPATMGGLSSIKLFRWFLQPTG